MAGPVLHAILICSDESCPAEFEAWGELDELDLVTCESCGCVLQPLSFGEARPQRPVYARPPVRLRPAA
jgi:hypothetical protein